MYIEDHINKSDNEPVLPHFELVSQSSALSWSAYIVGIIAIDTKGELASPNSLLLYIALEGFVRQVFDTVHPALHKFLKSVL